jgi:hypothetical protein
LSPALEFLHVLVSSVRLGEFFDDIGIEHVVEALFKMLLVLLEEFFEFLFFGNELINVLLLVKGTHKFGFFLGGGNSEECEDGEFHL